MPAYREKEPRYINFLIVPDGKEEPYTYRVRRGWLYVAGAFLALIVVLIVFGALSYWKVAEVALDYNRLKEENFKLVKSLQKIEKLKKDLEWVKQYETQIRSSLNGYVTIEEAADNDTLISQKLDFARMSSLRKRTIFNYVPSYMPVDGFMARGFETTALFTDPHLGLDIAAPTGTPVKAVANGVVLFSGWTDAGGYTIILEHDYGFISVYKHNERNLVNKLERVTRGQVIALLGNTGKITSGPHLHLEIWKNGLPVDPVRYLPLTKQ